MEWEGQRESENVEDARMVTPKRAAVGGGVGVVILLLLTWLLGGDPQKLLNQIQQAQPPGNDDRGAAVADPEQDKLVSFCKVVLADTEDVWDAEFRKMGKTYEKPKLHLFTGEVQSACGLTDAAVGPFYCPGDQKVYLDLSFFDQLRNRFRAPGNFAQAYVIAHEVGHHVQNLLGISDRVQSQRRQNRAEGNQLSVRLELQADFLAGYWAYHAQQMKNVLEPGDLDAALRAANAIGDDALQKKARGYVVPDSFTHGTSEQRIRWFRKGFDGGKFKDGDTFSIPYQEL
jgi:predicted metalloprotease